MDIVTVSRITKAVSRHGERFLTRIYTPGEVSYCSTLSNPYPSYAARFAAKEAVMKLLGEGLGVVRFTEIEVVRGNNGRPSVILKGEALKVAEKLGIGEVDISLAHERKTAIAMACAVASYEAQD